MSPRHCEERSDEAISTIFISHKILMKIPVDVYLFSYYMVSRLPWDDSSTEEGLKVISGWVYL